MNRIGLPLTFEPTFHSSFKSISKSISLIVIGVGCLVLVGWTMNIPVLKSILPGLASMKSNTALLFILSGASLWMQIQKYPQRIAPAFALIVVFVGLLTLGEYIFNSNFGIDQLLFQDTTVGILFPGRMAPSTAMAFFLTGLALLFFDHQNRYIFKDSLVLVVFAIAGLALIGYLYGVSSLYQIGAYSSMALHTDLSFILLSLAILFASPERGLMQTILADTAGGKVLRRFLPSAIIVPIFLGWISLLGQRAGMYDTAFGLALMVSSLITTMAIFICLNARELTNLDLKRMQLDTSLQASELRLQTSLADMMEGCQILGYDWRYLYINAAAEKHNRRPNSELLGKVYMDVWPGIEDTAVFPILQRSMAERSPQQMVNEFLFPDGSKGWFELSIQPVPDGIFILSSDVTNRKRAEQALIEREMKLSVLLEILPVGISILDAERNVTYTNPAMKTILGISEDNLSQGAYRNRKYLRTDGMPMSAEEFPSARAFQEKREINGVEMGIVIEDDRIVWTDVSAVPVDFPDWKLVMVTSDITERKRAQATNSYLAAVVESSNDAIISKDLSGVVTSWNAGAERVFGYTAQEMIGQPILRLIPADHIQEEEMILKQISLGNYVPDFETIRLTKNGKPIYVSVSISPIHDLTGKVVGASKVARDITERKKADEETRKLEERFSIAFRSSPAGLTITALADGKFLDANESYLQMLGYSREELIGNTSVELNMLSAEERAKPIQQLREHGRIRNIELQLRSKSGQLLDILYSSEQIELNGAACVLSIVVDTTERKQAEREILILNAELETKVAERTAELATANQHLHELSIVDELTGLYNRRGFLLHAEQQLLLAQRAKYSLLLFYADLDDLKWINDNLSHTAGDQALIAVANALRTAFRTSDIVARLGGDEFIVLAMEAEEYNAEMLVARLREHLASHSLSMSIGVVSIDSQNGETIDAIIGRADQAMYAEKRSKPDRRPE